MRQERSESARVRRISRYIKAININISINFDGCTDQGEDTRMEAVPFNNNNDNNNDNNDNEVHSINIDNSNVTSGHIPTSILQDVR